MKKLILGITLVAILGLAACEKEVLPPVTFSVKMLDTSFSPADFKVKEGQLVIIDLKNRGKALNNFALKGTKIRSITLKPEEETRLKFYAPDSGEYEAYSTIAGRAEQGMKASFIVE